MMIVTQRDGKIIYIDFIFYVVLCFTNSHCFCDKKERKKESTREKQ